MHSREAGLPRQIAVIVKVATVAAAAVAVEGGEVGRVGERVATVVRAAEAMGVVVARAQGARRTK